MYDKKLNGRVLHLIKNFTKIIAKFAWLQYLDALQNPGKLWVSNWNALFSGRSRYTPMPYTPCFIQLQNEFLDEAAGGGGMVQEEHKYKISFKKEWKWLSL